MKSHSNELHGIILNLTRGRLLEFSKVETLLGVKFRPDTEHLNPHYEIRKSGPNKDVNISGVEIRWPKSGNGSIMISIQVADDCRIGTDEILKLYPVRPDIAPPSPTQKSGGLLSYRYLLEGTKISYGFSASRPEVLQRVVIEYYIK